MAFDPLEYGYDPEIMAAQRKLEAVQQPGEMDFATGFTSGYDLTTDIGRNAWFSSGLPGLLLSKLQTEDTQKAWFIQRNAVDLGYNELGKMIASFEEISKLRELTPEEQNDYKTAVERKALLEEDLAFVYENFNGDLDAVIDSEGKSFNDRWGIDRDEEGDLGAMIGALAENPTYAGGMLTAGVIKDLPLLVVAKALGVAHKGMTMSNIIAKVNARLNQIQPKALRGLAKVGTGVGVGAGAGAGYEALYSALEQGEVKAAEVEIGAKFGGTFGLLGGAALTFKGPKATTPEVTTEAPKGSAIKQTEFIFEETDKDTVSKAAQETEIMPELNQEVSTIKGHPNDLIPFPGTKYDLDTNTVHTTINEAALAKAQKDVIQQLKDALSNDTDFRGVPASQIRGRDLENLTNKEAFKMFGLAHEKAKGAIIMEHQRKGMPVPEDVDAQAWSLAFDRFNKTDVERTQPNNMERINEETQLTPEELEAEAIRQQRLQKEVEEIENPEPPKTPVADFIKEKPYAALGAGATAGYALSPEEEKMAGVAVGAAAVLGGPRAYKALTAHSLKASAMKAKHALSKDNEVFASEAKILEYKMQEVIKEVKEVFATPLDGLRLISSIEENKVDGFSKREVEVRNKVKATLDIIGEAAVAAGVIKSKKDVSDLTFRTKGDKEIGHFLSNYFPHLFDVDLSEEKLQDLVNVYLKETKSKLQRKMLGTIEFLQKEHPEIVTDPVRALDTYVKAMSRTIYGKNLINSLDSLSMHPTGERHLPAMMSIEAFASLKKTDPKDGGLSSQEALHYQSFDHPTLEGYMAHSDIKPLIDDHFAILRRGGIGEVMEGILKLNNGLKRIFVFGSLFHAQALLLSAAYSLGPHFGTKGLGKKFKVKDENGNVIGEKEFTLADLKIGTGEFKEIAEEAIRDGLGIINIKKSDLLNPGFDQIQELLEKGHFIGGKQISKVFEKLDYVTWEYFHDRFKMATYIQKKQHLMDKEGLSPEAAGKLAARYANDAYGGLDWNDFATRLYKYAQNNPTKIRGILADKVAGLTSANKRRWLNLGLFAPDWTISNLRIVANTFVQGYKYSEGLLKAIHRGDDAAWRSKEGRELAAMFKLYGAYTAKAGAITSGMWWGMMQINNALWDNPEPTADGLMDFWFGEQSGKMQLGGGESMVISKQISEPYHWIQHPRHTLLNKMSIVPKTITEGMINKQWFSLKKGFPMGPSITDPDGTTHYAKWLLGKVVPISMKPFIDEKLTMEEKLERFSTGFIGFPQYGTYYDSDKTYELGVAK